MKLKAIFPNKDQRAFPQPVRQCPLTGRCKTPVTIIIPAAAIQRGPQGTFVYVVKADQTVTVRPVTVGEIQGGEASI